MMAVPVGAREEEEVPPRMVGTFYQAVVASVLIYGSESWVVSPTVMRELMGFHMEAVRRLTGMYPQKATGIKSIHILLTFWQRRTYSQSNVTSRSATTPCCLFGVKPSFYAWVTD